MTNQPTDKNERAIDHRFAPAAVMAVSIAQEMGRRDIGEEIAAQLLNLPSAPSADRPRNTDGMRAAMACEYSACVGHDLTKARCDHCPIDAVASSERAQEASSACPICGHDQPHSHSDGEVHAWLKAQAGRFGLTVFVCNESDTRAKEAFAISEDEKARGRAAFEGWFGPRTRHLSHCKLNRNDQPGAEGQYIAIATQENWNVWEAAWQAAKSAPSATSPTKEGKS